MFTDSTGAARYAYFTMELGLEDEIPTYAGGLGILAGDTVRSAADLGVPLVAISLLHRLGYFYQRISSSGAQVEEPVRWPIDDYLEPVPCQIQLELDSCQVKVGAWRRNVRGVMGNEVAVFFLDTKLEGNRPDHQNLSERLYGGDHPYRLRQEALLGMGGIKLLRALGYTSLIRYHLNEGHASLAVIELLQETMRAEKSLTFEQALMIVRPKVVFTTHTPIPAGHDRFRFEEYRPVLGESCSRMLNLLGQGSELNMTELALRAAGYVNGVALRHGEVSRGMFPNYPISSITNGVHAERWASPSFAKLFDRFLPDWRRDHQYLRYAIEIENDEIWRAHIEAKQELLDFVNSSCNAGFDRDVLTIGFARRMTAYKRPLLLLKDIERLKAIAAKVGSLQIIFAGKAHPQDLRGKEIIAEIHARARSLEDSLKIAYLPNYDMQVARLCCAGVDVWLNTPLKPLEASGTSGMKAAVNGVPSLSILDGWWIEGLVEGVTGWGIGGSEVVGDEQADTADAESLYSQLEHKVLPTFYHSRENFKDIMRNSIALNGSFFNTQRMLWQYLHVAYNGKVFKANSK